MSATRAAAIRCDTTACEMGHVHVAGNATLHTVRDLAATSGWTHHGDSDHCPEHSKPPKPSTTKRRLRDRTRQALTLPR